MMKKITALVLSFTLLFSLCIPIYATVETAVTAQVAFVSGVNETGSNIGDDRDPSSETTIAEIPINVSSTGDYKLFISANIDGKAVDISAIPVAHSANKHAIYFDAESNNSNFEVIHTEYVDNAETNMYFKDYCTSISANHILKIYLRDPSSESRNYIFLEVFDYTLPDSGYLTENLPQDTTKGSWYAKEFLPISSTSYTAYTEGNSIPRTYSSTFTPFALEQTHTITVSSDCTYTDFTVGQNADIVYRLEITGKTIECPEDPTQNSDTESYLHVDKLSLRQTSIPNAAFISESIDGVVLGGGGGLSASLGVSLGALGISLDLADMFSDQGSVDINQTYKGFVNGRNGQYTRSVKTTMNDRYKLTQIGHYFDVRCTMGDFVEEPASSKFHQAEWDITLINGSDLSTSTYHITHNAPISVV